ncbi:hypothetical protein AALA61_07090 [Oscillospiraceae bacterium 42-9]
MSNTQYRKQIIGHIRSSRERAGLSEKQPAAHYGQRKHASGGAVGKMTAPSITATDEELNKIAEEIAHEMEIELVPEKGSTQKEPKWAQNFRQRFEKVE